MPHPLFETISPRPLVQRQLLNGNSSTASGGCSPTRAHRSHPTRSRRHCTVPVSRFWRRFASILKPSTIPQATLPACPSHFIRRATSCSWESGPSLAGAPDVLVFPVVLGCPAHIVSTCPVTGTGIQLTVKEDHIEDLSPASTTFSIVKDGGMLGKLKEADCIRQGSCDHQFFFTSQQVVAPWVCEHADFMVFPVEEAFQGLREVARHQQARAAQA